MEKAVVQLPECSYALLNERKVDIKEVESVLIIGSSSIPSLSFSNLHKLKSVTISDEVTGIETQVFDKCTSLEEIRFGKGIKYIGSYSFGECKAIKELIIPGNIKKIGSQSFMSLIGLKHLVIEDGVEYIGGNSFCGCRSLEKIELPEDSIKDIGGPIFERSEWLDNNKDVFVTISGILTEYRESRKNDHVIIPDHIKGMIHHVFMHTSFKEIEIGRDVKYISNYAFQGNHSLENVVIPEGVVEIGDDIFKNCSSIKHVKVPESLIRVGANSLKPEYISDHPRNGCVYAGKAVIGCVGNPRSVEIKDGTYSISPGSFDQAQSLKAIILPDTIREINCSFMACKQLSLIVIPKDVPSACLAAFESMKDIRFVTCPQSKASEFAKEKGFIVEYLDPEANPNDTINKLLRKRQPRTKVFNGQIFSKCFRRTGNALAGFSSRGLKEIHTKQIKSITIPTEIEGNKIERLVFDCLSVLKEAPEVEELIIPGEMKIQGLTTTDGPTCWDFPNTETIKRLVFTGRTPINFYYHIRTFDESLESISIQDSDHFVSYDGVIYSKNGKILVYYPRSKKDKKFIVPSTVTEIWGSAFQNAKYLEELVLPKGLEDISKDAFRNSSVKKINLPGLKNISDNAFLDCKLESVVLSEGIKWIGRSAFQGCTAATVVFPKSLDSIHTDAFSHSTSKFTFLSDTVRLDYCSFMNCHYSQFAGASKTMRRKITVAGLNAPMYLSPTYKATKEDIINLIKTLCGETYDVDESLSIKELQNLFQALLQESNS